MRRALVTGATGFIGRRLVEVLLERGVEVRCLVRPSARTEPLVKLGVDLVTGDVCDPDHLGQTLHDCDYVFHLAGKTSAVTRDELYRTNVYGSYIVAQACARQLTPPRLLLVSSLAAAGTAIAGRLRREDEVSRPVSEYGRSKRGGELAAAAWARRVPISVVRPAIVFGPRNREMLPMFQAIGRFRVHPVPGYSTRRVGLIHIDDLVEVLWRVAHHGRPIPADWEQASHPRHAGTSAGIYQAAAPEFPTYAQLGRMIGIALGNRRTLVLPIAESLVWIAAGATQGLDRLRRQSGSFNLDKMREAFAGDWTGYPERLERELDFHPQHTLQQRLTETADWYLREGWL
jgi:nucleoside-diphosphate-sugar epimerase